MTQLDNKNQHVNKIVSGLVRRQFFQFQWNYIAKNHIQDPLTVVIMANTLMFLYFRLSIVQIVIIIICYNYCIIVKPLFAMSFKSQKSQMIGSNSPFLMYCTWQIKSDLIHLPCPQSVSFLLHTLLSPSSFTLASFHLLLSLFFPSYRLQGSL